MLDQDTIAGQTATASVETTQVQDPHVAAATKRASARLSRLARRFGTPGNDPLDPLAVAYGSTWSVGFSTRAVTYACDLVHPESWVPVGCVVARGRRTRGVRGGYMRAAFLNCDVFEAYAHSTVPGRVALFSAGACIGWWQDSGYTYEGRFKEPIQRELWSQEARVGMLDTALLNSGCGVLEMDPEGGPLIPMRVRPPELLLGNPITERLKALPFGRVFGTRSACLDTVLTAHAARIEDDRRLLVFAASLAMRMLIAPLWTSVGRTPAGTITPT